MAKAKKKQAKTQDFSSYIKWFWKLFIASILFAVLLFLLASWGVFGALPDHTVLENPKTNLATEIISSDGETLGKFYFNDNRTPVGYNDLPQHLVDALIATEDARYYEHSGIDARGTLRAFVKLGSGGGASTISQQLAKQLFHGEGSKNIIERITQKLKEWVIAIKLERQYTKEEIIAMYFNIYDFGNNADGIRSAASIYFDKEPMELDIKESAMLVGMFKNSSLYNPRPHRNPEGVKNRRNVVLAQMEKYDFITETVKDSLQKLDLGLRYSPESHREGTATYFRAYLDKFMKDWIKKNPKPDGTKWNLYNDVWQAGAMLLPVNSVGVMGDERTYEKVVALRAVSSTDGMTADWVNLPYEFLQETSNKIINGVKGVNRVVYDISSKPPATIEWE